MKLTIGDAKDVRHALILPQRFERIVFPRLRIAPKLWGRPLVCAVPLDPPVAIEINSIQTKQAHEGIGCSLGGRDIGKTKWHLRHLPLVVGLFAIFRSRRPFVLGLLALLLGHDQLGRGRSADALAGQPTDLGRDIVLFDLLFRHLYVSRLLLPLRCEDTSNRSHFYVEDARRNYKTNPLAHYDSPAARDQYGEHRSALPEYGPIWIFIRERLLACKKPNYR